jgi:hypothetical protein
MTSRPGQIFGSAIPFAIKPWQEHETWRNLDGISTAFDLSLKHQQPSGPGEGFDEGFALLQDFMDLIRIELNQGL